MSAPPLVIAGHGTRVAEGAAVSRALVDRIRRLLPGVQVEAGFVELTPPTVDQALATALETSASAVVVPLMIGKGGHVRDDIPDSMQTALQAHPDAQLAYARHLGSPEPLVSAARQRILTAADDWSADSVTVVFVGRGCSVTAANADHVRLGRVVLETAGLAQVLPAFIQVVGPTVTEALDLAYASGSRRIVTMPHYLFPGKLTEWVSEAVQEWQRTHPDAEVRLAEPIGDCPELAQIVVERYQEGVRQLADQPRSHAMEHQATAQPDQPTPTGSIA